MNKSAAKRNYFNCNLWMTVESQD